MRPSLPLSNKFSVTCEKKRHPGTYLYNNKSLFGFLLLEINSSFFFSPGNFTGQIPFLRDCCTKLFQNLSVEIVGRKRLLPKG